jgi:hypothetical protein
MSKARKIKPEYTFDLYVSPRHSPRVVRVMIHRNQRRMLVWRGDSYSGDSTEAFCQACDTRRLRFDDKGGSVEVVDHVVAVVHFHPGSLSMGVVAHELFHAVIAWARMEACLPCSEVEPADKKAVLHLPDHEERCAEVMGGLMAQFVVNLAKRVPKWSLRWEQERGYYSSVK